MTTTITPDITNERTNPLTALGRGTPLLRDGAQQAAGQRAGFSEILQTQLDAAGPISPATESEPTVTPTDEAEPAGTGEHDAAEDSSQAEGETGQATGAEASKTEAGAEQPSDSTPTTTGSADSARTSEQGSPAPENGRQAEEIEAQRRFITEHGKRAAKLRWDSIGVELTHAAEINIAEQSVQKLASRGGHGETTPRAANESTGDTPRATPTRAPATSADSGKNIGDSAGRETGELRAVSDRPASRTPETAEASGAPTGSEVKTPTAPTSTQAVAVVGTTAHGQRPLERGSAPVASRSDLVARLGTLNGVAPTPVTSKGTVNAIEGVSRVMLRAERSGPLQTATPTASKEKNETIRQVQQGLARLIKNSGGESTVRLTPKALGEVTVRLEIREGVASARFTATNDVARGLLQSGLNELHAALETRGVRVDRLTVDTDASKTPAESARHEVRAEPQAPRASDGSPGSHGSGVADRPEADAGGRGGHPGGSGHSHGQGRPGDQQAEASTRSVDVSGHEPLSFEEPAGLDRWIRLDTVA